MKTNFQAMTVIKLLISLLELDISRTIKHIIIFYNYKLFSKTD